MPQLISATQLHTTIKMLGLPEEKFRAEALKLGIDPEVFSQESYVTISPQQFGTIFMSLVRHLQDTEKRDSGELKRVLALSDYRLMYTYIIHAKNLGEALERASNYFSRFEVNKKTFTVNRTGHSCHWGFDLGPIAANHSPEAEHLSMDQLHWLPGLPGRMLAMYLWHRTISWLIGDFVDLQRVNFDCPAFGDANAYSEAFYGPVYFNAGWCGIEFHERYLDAPIVQSEKSLDRMLASFPAELMEVDHLRSSMTARVRGIIGNDVAIEMPTLEVIAERLFTTSATLHRRLQEEGTSYQQLKDHCRRDAAILMLRDNTLTGTRLAEYLGFSDPSTFYRAFKKWTGMTPSEFKKRNA